MANASFGVNILPKNNTVTIGNSDSPWTIVSPSLTGTPTAPTPTAGDSSTKIATTEFVDNAIDTAPKEYGEIIEFELDNVSNVSGSYSHTSTVTGVTANMKAIGITVGNSEAFLDDVTITFGNGTITLECDNVVGSSTVTVAAFVVEELSFDPAVTSAEYIQLNSVKLDKATFNNWRPPNNGINDQILRSNGDGTTRWDSPATTTEINTAVTSWLNTNVPTDTTVVIDRSLTQDNCAANSKTVGDELSELKSAFDNTVVMNAASDITISGSWTLTGGFSPVNGRNITSSKSFRFGFQSIPYPFAFDMSDSDYRFLIWTYSSQSQSTGVYSPTGCKYTQKKTKVYPTDEAVYFRISFSRVDSADLTTGASDPTSDEYRIKNSIRFWQVTDKSLSIGNVPADAKAAGDKITDIESDINNINIELVENGKNLIPHHTDESGTTSSGLNYSCENDVWTIEGENGDSIWFKTLAGSADAFPFGLKAGDTVKLYASVLNDTNVYMAFRPYKNGTALTAYQYDTDREFTIPSDADAMQIRIEVPKNRTVSSAVTYKPEVRMTDTNKQLETRVEALENAEQTDNSSNIIEPFNREETTSKGLTYSATDGVLTISGTATGTWYTVVGGSDTKLPDGIEPGKTYFFWLDGPEGLRLSMYSFPGSDNIFETSSFGYFTIPADATAMQIRVRVPNGQVIPQGTIVYPYIGENIPNVSLKTLFRFRNEKPMLTIIDDDGNSKFYTKLLPVIIEKNVPITSATVCGYIDNPSDHSSMTWDQVVECYQKGAEIVSHTMTHVTGTAAETMTEREIERDYRMSRNVLASHGIPTNILVYAGNSGNLDKCVNAAKKTFDYAFHSDGGKVIKQNNFRPFYIQRYGIGIGSFVMQEGETVPSVPKGYIDNCIANPGWIVWMVHTSTGDWTDEQVNGIKASIDYALNNGVDIVSCEYALKQFVKV